MTRVSWHEWTKSGRSLVFDSILMDDGDELVKMTLPVLEDLLHAAGWESKAEKAQADWDYDDDRSRYVDDSA